MKKIVFILVMLVNFSAHAVEDYSQYYFTGKFDVKDMGFETEGKRAMTTRSFHIHEGMAYLAEHSSGFDVKEPMPDGLHKLITDKATKISFFSKDGKISNLNIVNLEKKLKDSILTPCKKAGFTLEYLGTKENLKEDKGAHFIKYGLINYPSAAGYYFESLFVFKDDKNNKLMAVTSEANGFFGEVGLEKPESFTKYKNSNNLSLITKNVNSVEKYLDVDNCFVTYSKDQIN